MVDLGARARQWALSAGQLRPNRKGRVLYNSFNASISDNPRAVYEALRDRPGFEHVWVGRSDRDLKPGARTVAFGSAGHYLALATAQTIVSNVESPPWLRSRPGRTYVQTWHGTPLKRVGLDIKDRSSYPAHFFRDLVADASKWTHLIAQNAFSAEILPGAFGYEGPVLVTGYPRTDALRTTTEADRALRRRALGIPPERTAVLYAPTFRDRDFKTRTIGALPLDVAALASALPPTHVVLLRVHPAMHYDAGSLDGDRVVDVSAVADMRDLLTIADVLVTDYSSSLFDFAVTGRPIVLFVPDLDYYRDESRGLYLDIEEIAPGPVVVREQDLAGVLEERAQWVPDERYEAFRTRFCPVDDGHASERVADLVSP